MGKGCKMVRCKHLNVVIVEYSKVGSTLDVLDGNVDNTMYHSHAVPAGYTARCMDCKKYYPATVPGRWPKWLQKYWDEFIENGI